MDRGVPVLMGVIAASQAVLGVLFALQVPLATDLWPFPGTNQMSFTFIASIFLAASASTAWCLFVRSERALGGVALDYIVIMVPFSVLSLAFALDDGDLHAASFGLVCIAALVFGAWLLRWSLRRPWRTANATPRPVVVAFMAIVVTLVIVGSLLVARVPGILPWPVTPQLSAVFGSMFLGASAYFAYGLVDRRWENAGGQLAGFLAYDIVLILPFAARIVSGEPSYYGSPSEPLRLNLVVYTLVIVLSAIIAGYYLLIHPATRLRAGYRSPGSHVVGSEPIKEPGPWVSGQP
jgi:hypothetical protein